MDLDTAVEIQADHREAGSRGNGGSGRGGGGGGSGGGGSSGGEASSDGGSGSSGAATAKPEGRTCWVCNSNQHYARDYPKQICQGCGERGHHITKCGKTENTMMAVDILGITSSDEDSPVLLRSGTRGAHHLRNQDGECLVSVEEEAAIKQMGDDLWFLDTGATGHFTYDPRSLESYAERSRVLRRAGGNTFPIVGTGTLRISLRFVRGGGLGDAGKYCACSRPFSPFSVAETYCRCGGKIHRYPREYPNKLCKIWR